MKCENCGAELKPGNVYCSVCGTAVQLVPDYNLLDEDLLGDIIQEEARGSSTGAAPEVDYKKRVRRKKGLAVGITAAVLITVFFRYVLCASKGAEFSYGKL